VGTPVSRFEVLAKFVGKLGQDFELSGQDFRQSASGCSATDRAGGTEALS